MQYNALKHAGIVIEDSKTGLVTIKQHLLRALITDALRRKAIFDEKYYLTSNPDIAAGIASGKIASAADHYYNTGYFEGRMPMRIDVDESFYLKLYPDVARGVRLGVTKNGQTHFDAKGFSEGRLPYEGFSLY